MKPQSKSKTFPKGTELERMGDFIKSQVETIDAPNDGPSWFKSKSKVLITITKFPEKEEGK